MKQARTWWLVLSAVLAGCVGPGDGDRMSQGRGEMTSGGVRLVRRAQTLAGSAANCTRPATIDMLRVRRATPEGREIERDGVREGTARFELLMGRIHRRVVRAANEAARDLGHDLVVRQGDIRDSRGLVVTDLTDAVIARLGNS